MDPCDRYSFCLHTSISTCRLDLLYVTFLSPFKLLVSIEKQLKTHGDKLELITEEAGERKKGLEQLLVVQQEMHQSLLAISERLTKVEESTHDADHDKHPSGALLKRLRRGDLRQDDEDGGGGTASMGVLREGLLASILGIRPPDMRNGIDGSRIISPKSPFYSGTSPARINSLCGHTSIPTIVPGPPTVHG
jgi:hypothetical protein